MTSEESIRLIEDLWLNQIVQGTAIVSTFRSVARTQCSQIDRTVEHCRVSNQSVNLVSANTVASTGLALALESQLARSSRIQNGQALLRSSRQ